MVTRIINGRKFTVKSKTIFRDGKPIVKRVFDKEGKTTRTLSPKQIAKEKRARDLSKAREQTIKTVIAREEKKKGRSLKVGELAKIDPRTLKATRERLAISKFRTQATAEKRKFTQFEGMTVREALQKDPEFLMVTDPKLSGARERVQEISISRDVKKFRVERNNILKDSGLNIISKGFTEAQKDKLFKGLNANLQAELFRIEKSNISEIDKNLLKRQLLNISPPRITNKQIESRARQITGTIKPRDESTKRILINLQDDLSSRLRRIRNLPIEKRTLVNNIDAVASGLGATGVATARKLPTGVWNFFATFFKPKEVVDGMYKLLTDPTTQKAVNNKIAQFSKELQAGEPEAIATIASEIISFKAGNKILQEFGKVASVTKAVRIAKEIKFVLQQPKELRPFVKQILKASRIQEKLTPNNLKFVKKINFNEVQELTRIEASALKKTLQETDSFVFGSLGSRAITKGKTKIPKDVDIATKNKDLFNKKFISNLPKTQRGNYIIKGEKLLTKQGRALYDIKAYSRLRPNQTIFGTGRLPINTVVYRTNKPVLKQAGVIQPTQKLIQIEGIKLLGFGEQTTRKGLGTLQVILEKTGRRAKDPAAFIESLEIQLAALEGKIPKTNIVNKFILKLKAKDLRNAVKILKSKAFQNLLNKKVPGLAKEFPILAKLKNTKFAQVSKRVRDRIKKIKDKAKPKKKPTVKKKPTPKKKPSKVPKPSRIPESRIPKSRVPKSRVPSRLKASRIRPSRIAPSDFKAARSRLAKIKPSALKVSRVSPSKVAPSRVTPSRLTPSRLRPSRIPSSRIPPSKVPSKKIPPVKSLVPKFSWDFKKRDDRVLVFDIVFRERKTVSRNFNKKSNPVVVKTKRVRTTRNRALNKAMRLADNKTVRSIQTKLVGNTGKKLKDTTLDSRLVKFVPRKTTKVLTFVEKSKFTIDSKGEKKGLKKAKKRGGRK